MSWLSIISKLVYKIREALNKGENCDVSEILDLKSSQELYVFLIRSTSSNLIEYTYVLLAILNTKGDKYTEEFTRDIFLPLCSATINTHILSENQLINIWKRNVKIHYDGVFPQPIKDTLLSITKNGDLEPFELEIFTKITKLIMYAETSETNLF